MCHLLILFNLFIYSRNLFCACLERIAGRCSRVLGFDLKQQPHPTMVQSPEVPKPRPRLRLQHVAHGHGPAAQQTGPANAKSDNECKRKNKLTNYSYSETVTKRGSEKKQQIPEEEQKHPKYVGKGRRALAGQMGKANLQPGPNGFGCPESITKVGSMGPWGKGSGTTTRLSFQRNTQSSRDRGARGAGCRMAIARGARGASGCRR